MDRRLATRERLDLLRDDVARDHRMAQLGEAGRRHQADPADADHPHRLLRSRHPLAPFRLGLLLGMITFAERAIPIIWSLVKVLRRSFITQ